jgi:hypothetical protein
MSFISLSVGWKITVAPLAGLPSTVTLPVTGTKEGPPLPQPMKVVPINSSSVKTTDDEGLQTDISDS